MYEAFFGLRANPFRLSPDAAFLFESRGHRQAHAWLRYALSEGEGFLVMTGEIGAGKTTLIHALLQELDPQRLVAAHLVSTQLGGGDLLRAVALAFGLPAAADQPELRAAIRSHLLELAEQERRALLIVDEAQNLAPLAFEELRLLSEFQDVGYRSPLQTFLIGQPELRTLMDSAPMTALRQRVIADFHLGPIDREETAVYIEHRLRNVGWARDPSLDPAVPVAIHQACGGIPRRINALCNRLLLAAFIHQQHHIETGDVTRAVKELQDEPDPRRPLRPPLAPSVEIGIDDAMRLSSRVDARLERLERRAGEFLELVRRYSETRVHASLENRPRQF